eukprot:Nitzschia sp. Nitz4//scaffold43_size134323//48137//49347//NITZ4_003295-RA/size134323-augustus-gene-0.233-mRNA-1//-1//CDS//3329551936//7192//frame0
MEIYERSLNSAESCVEGHSGLQWTKDRHPSLPTILPPRRCVIITVNRTTQHISFSPGRITTLAYITMCRGETPTVAEADQIPYVAKLWRSTYLVVPKLNFPGTEISISFSLVSAAFLILVRWLATKFLENVIGFPEGDEAAASVAGVFHSSLLCPGLLAAFATHKYHPTEALSQAPRWWQQLADALLQFCTGYMIYDAVFTCVIRLDPSVSWIPALTADDTLFMVHHLMTSTYMTQARIYKAGHMSAMMCMLLGEASNPIMNTWFVTAKAVTFDCCNGSAMLLIHKYIEIAFCIIYFLFRVVLGPIGCMHMSFKIVFSPEARKLLPWHVRLLWNIMIWGVVFGSYSWIVYCQELLTQHLAPVVEQEL